MASGPDAGKLALLDFGLVAEIPAYDREAMVSATIHLANRDWGALVDDFIALGFLPRDAGGCAGLVWCGVVRAVHALAVCLVVCRQCQCVRLPTATLVAERTSTRPPSCTA